VAIKGHGTQFVRVGDEGGRFTFTFCPKCGSTVFYVEEGDEQHIASGAWMAWSVLRRPSSARVVGAAAQTRVR
jgi:hypothetical protein